MNKECIIEEKDRNFCCLYSQVFSGGRVCVRRLPEGRPRLLKVSEMDAEENSR